jgi:hypothetical protein
MPTTSRNPSLRAVAADNDDAPRRRMCGAMSVHQRLLEIVPNFRANQHALEHRSAERRRSGLARVAAADAGPVVIPTIVHVVYNTDEQNISEEQVKSQMKVLNADYSATNADKTKVPDPWKGLVIDTGIQFELTEIKRVPTEVGSFGDDDGVKFSESGGSDAVDTSRHLNIWVCNLEPWLGYAQFPGGLPETDGVVIVYTAFGVGGTASDPYHKGRTATHEVGHWLNLRHIWGDTEDCSGSDFAEDTPNAAGPNFGKPAFPSVSCSNGPNGDMFMNYMDYVDDEAMFMFTAQQVARMSATLDGPRSGLARVDSPT